MKALVLGLLVGALVALDPLATTYLLRDYPLRDLPFALSLSAVLAISAALLVKTFYPGLAGRVIEESARYFPFVFLFAYQFTGVSAGPLDPTEVVIGVFSLLLLFGLFLNPDRGFVPTPLNLLHVLLGICIVVSLVSYFNPQKFLKTAKPFLLFFLMVNALREESVLFGFLRWLIILAVLSGVFAIVQEVVWLTTQTILSLIDPSQLERMFDGPIFRVPAMMVSYRSFALYLAMAILLIVSALMWQAHWRPMRRGWLIASLAITAVALLMTTAKDIFLGLALALSLLFVLQRPRRIVAIAVGGIAVATMLAALTAYVPGNVDTAVELAKVLPKEEQQRIRLDRDSIEGFAHGPYTWFGRGVGAGARYTGHPLGWPAHNAFILAAVELGVAGLMVYLLIYAFVIARVIALNVIVTDGPYLPVVRALLATLIVVLVGAQFEASYLDIFVWTIFATVEAVWFVLRRQNGVSAGRSTAPLQPG